MWQALDGEEGGSESDCDGIADGMGVAEVETTDGECVEDSDADCKVVAVASATNGVGVKVPIGHEIISVKGTNL